MEVGVGVEEGDRKDSVGVKRGKEERWRGGGRRGKGKGGEESREEVGLRWGRSRGMVGVELMEGAGYGESGDGGGCGGRWRGESRFMVWVEVSVRGRCWGGMGRGRGGEGGMSRSGSCL